MFLSKLRTLSLSNWRSSLALTGMIAALAGVSAGACGAPPVDGPGNGGSGSSSATSGGSTDIDPTSGSASSSTTSGTTISEIPDTGQETTEETTEPMGVDGEFCSDFAIEFVPRMPAVYILVDQSSSMFTPTNMPNGPANFWEALKGGVLNVVEALQTDVRFGFASYTGTSAMCTGLQATTPIDLNNYDAIKTTYDAQKDIMVGFDQSTKGETPTAGSIMEVTEILLQDPVPGDKFIILVTDGDPDFCDDGSRECAVDATVGALQYAYSQGIKSFVFGIENAGLQYPEVFDYFAQAASGEEPNWMNAFDRDARRGALSNVCNEQKDLPVWDTVAKLLGNFPPEDECGVNIDAENGNEACWLPAANYSMAGGTAQAFLDPDPTVLAEQILSQVKDLKSCTIAVNFEVTAGSEELGEIYVGDLVNPIPATDWQMPTPSSIQLMGASCDLWLLETTKDFFAGFPCEVIKEVDIIR